MLFRSDLEDERSLSAELTLRWQASGVAVYGTVFRNRVDDYIERIDVSPDVRSFVNLTSGVLRGVELQGHRGARG